MAIENFTTYTEVDAPDYLSIAASKITATALLNDTDHYVYKDFTANHFDDLNVNFDINTTAQATKPYGECGIALANTVSQLDGFANTDLWVGAMANNDNSKIIFYQWEFYIF